jgi:hypothetical protein
MLAASQRTPTQEILLLTKLLMLDQTKQEEAPCKTVAMRSLTVVDTEARRSKLFNF